MAERQFTLEEVDAAAKLVSSLFDEEAANNSYFDLAVDNSIKRARQVSRAKHADLMSLTRRLTHLRWVGSRCLGRLERLVEPFEALLAIYRSVELDSVRAAIAPVLVEVGEMFRYVFAYTNWTREVGHNFPYSFVERRGDFLDAITSIAAVAAEFPRSVKIDTGRHHVIGGDDLARDIGALVRRLWVHSSMLRGYAAMDRKWMHQIVADNPPPELPIPPQTGAMGSTERMRKKRMLARQNIVPVTLHVHDVAADALIRSGFVPPDFSRDDLEQAAYEFFSQSILRLIEEMDE